VVLPALSSADISEFTKRLLPNTFNPDYNGRQIGSFEVTIIDDDVAFDPVFRLFTLITLISRISLITLISLRSDPTLSFTCSRVQEQQFFFLPQMKINPLWGYGRMDYTADLQTVRRSIL
jgi:hypothetical protein